MQYYHPDEEVVPGHFLVRSLGRGGFGVVWKATGPGGVELAIKIINLGNDQGFKEFRAVRLLRKLRHPNLVPLFGFWLKDDRGSLIGDNAADSPTRIAGAAAEMIIAMGLGEKSLLDRLEECKKAGVKGIPTVELLDYLEDAARAIDYLNDPCHDLGQGPVGIQHCDIKPANLLIVGNAAQVCDFGLVRVLGDQARSSTADPLTRVYVAPEMLENKPCRQTDQYSLAITYYELRTGKWPFSGSDRTAAIRAHQSGNLDFSAVPSAEQRVMKRATSLEPDQRYPSTVEMVQELRRAATEIRPPSRGEIYIGGPVQPNQELVPGHKLVRRIGQGGYGEVWEGVAPGGIRCAFKIISNLDASQNVQEFRVLEMMKGLEHDHLMALQAYWLLDGEGKVLPEGPEAESSRAGATMLVIQTQLAAKNLSQRLKECQSTGWPGIPPQELLPYIRQAASALDYLNAPQHHLGERVLSIQHRDIKPENILLSRQGSVKVTDFGLAKMVEGTSATIHSKSRGLTAAYAAPEMFKGMVTRSTDQYSLAITYYRLRTGKLPFDQNQPLFSMMLVHTEGRLDFGLLSLAEQEVLQRATKVNPEDRFPSCLDMIGALEAALGVRPETTTSVSVTTRGSQVAVIGEPTRVGTSVQFSGDKGHLTAPQATARTAPPPPLPPRAEAPPTLPPTPHPSGQRACIVPASVPPLPPTQLIQVGEFDFASGEPPALPGCAGNLNVTVTRVREPKQKASPAPQPERAEVELVPDLVDTAFPSGDLAVGRDVVRVASAENKKVVVPSRRRRRLAEIVVGSLLAMVLGYLAVYFLWFRPTSGGGVDPGQTLDLVQTRIRDGAFEEALRELDEAALDEKTKNEERAKVVSAWLDRLGPLTEGDAHKQVEGLRALRRYVKDNEEVNQRYRDALALDIPARAEKLRKAGDFPGAVDLLQTFEPEGQPKAVLDQIRLTENRVLSAWVGDARQHRKEKAFNKANKVLKALLQKRPGHVEAVDEQKEVAKQIAEVHRERDRLTEVGKFPDALKYVAD
ncbi:MAG TPA: serine/threonine-protein kinase, partial [Gemmataceae bacterium]|nr:serine/threonine-protein kinase [Gemmataceae bacterium]